MSSDVMNIDELAAYLDVATSTLYKKVQAREIPFTKIGNLLRFTRPSIDAWLARNTTHPDDALFEQFARLQNRYHFQMWLESRGIDPNQDFVGLSIVDFDPAGYGSAHNFLDQLKLSGLANFRKFRQYEGTYRWLDLVQPKNLTGADLDLVKYRLPAQVRRSKKCATWAANTGGVDGRGSRTHGLESDEFTLERLGELVTEAATPFLRTPPEVVARRTRMREIEKAVTDFMVHKLLEQGRPVPDRPVPAALPEPALA